MNTSRTTWLALLLGLSILQVAFAEDDEVVVYPAMTVADTATIEGRVVDNRESR